MIFSKPVRFIVLTPGRSGSNYLLSLFDSHPRITHFGEIFGPSNLENLELRKEIDREGFIQYFKSALTRKGFEKAIGAKFLYAYFRDEFIERHRAPGLREVYRHLIDSTDIRVIHLWRANPLRVLVSFEIAARTKRFLTYEEYEEKVNLVLAPDFIERRVDEILKEQNWVRRTFNRHRVLEISYEQLTESPENSAKLLMKFLGVDSVPLASGTKKQNSRQLSEILENFDELQSYFTDTHIEPFLHG